ncbi:MAG: rRNA pseudouridine synthase [Opitutaceae bacterium]|jgi:16S rRNA pseudouridine516 synthase|nr:rRNA pseudouridine synthase [Opitutaceae bacterium]
MTRRVDQLLASLGYCSRSEARLFLKHHDVRAGETRLQNPAGKTAPDGVRVDGEPLDNPGGLFLMLHKPAGLVCSHDPREGPLVHDLLPERWRRRNPRVTSVGRLDKATTGLLLLTDQSEWVHRLTSPARKVPKRYLARLDKPPPPELVPLFASGEKLLLDGETKPCAPAVLALPGGCRAEITLTEGKYHQVRRMFAAVGLTVLELHRAAFGRLELGNLPPGHWRPVSPDEI